MPAASGLQDRRVALALVLAFTVFYWLPSHGHFDSSDEIAVYEATRSLWENGDLVVGRGTHVFPGHDGRLYSHFAVGQSLLALPFYGLGRALRALPETWVSALAGARHPPRGRNGGSIEIYAVTLYPVVASALLVGLFYLFSRRLGAGPGNAALASLLLGGCSYVLPHAAYFLRHTSESLAILAALYGLHGYARSGRLRPLLAGAAAGALIPLIRLPAAAAGPALAAYLLWALGARRRAGDSRARCTAALALAALPLLAALAVHVGVNHAKWGSWLDSPMLGQRSFFTGEPWTGLRGLLLSPGASLFVYTPLLLLAPWAFRRLFRSHPAEAAALLGVVCVFLLSVVGFWSWSGLWAAPGPRYLFVATPLLLLPLGPWLESLQGPARHWALRACALLGGLGALVNGALVSARWRTVVHVMDYRKWEPGMEFLFEPSLSPAWASARVALSGEIDWWIWWLATGWQGQPGRPAAALAVLILWLAGFGFALRHLRRTLRAARG